MATMTNREFGEKDEVFKTACAIAGLPNHKNVVHTRNGTTVTGGVKTLTRQASKWRMKKGIAWEHRPK